MVKNNLPSVKELISEPSSAAIDLGDSRGQDE